MKRLWVGAVVSAAAVLVGAGAAGAAEVKVLSAGALEPPMRAALAGWEKATRNTVKVEFRTAGEIRERAKAPLAEDVIAAPDPLIAELVSAGRVLDRPIDLGKVGVGLAVKTGAPVPDVSTEAALRAALLKARVVVYNRASSGVSVEGMIGKLGVSAELAAKTQRFPDAAQVMTHLIGGTPDEIGFGAPTAISLYTGRGLRYAGPVPASLQSWTYYKAVPTPAATPLAKSLLDYLDSAEGRRVVLANGLSAR